MLCSSLQTRVISFFRDYDCLQYSAIILIYSQIGCALIGSLGALYTGVLLVHLTISLFALVAIESSSQSLGRTYALLLAFGILLDVFWFLLFAPQIWAFSSGKYEPLLVSSLWLTLSMQIVGLFVRLMSSVIWIQIYRLGVSSVASTASREADFDVRNSFLNPSPAIASTPARQNSHSNDFLGGVIYDPAYYSSLFEDIQENGPEYVGKTPCTGGSSGSSPLKDSSQLRSCIGKSFQVHNGNTLGSVDGSGSVHKDCLQLKSSTDKFDGGSGSSPLKIVH